MESIYMPLELSIERVETIDPSTLKLATELLLPEMQAKFPTEHVPEDTQEDIVYVSSLQ